MKCPVINLDIGNTIDPDIKLTGDCLSLNENGYILLPEIRKGQNWYKSPNLSRYQQPDSVLMINSMPNEEVKEIFEEPIKNSKLKIILWSALALNSDTN